MIEISPLTESDRAEWEALSRAFYDTVGRFKGFITYTRPLDAEQNSARG
jgi:hypothetical protein